MSHDIKKILAEMRPSVDAEIEKIVPRKFDEKSLARLCGKPRYEYDLETATKAIAEPIWDLLDRGGKRWRPVLLLLTAEAFGGDLEKIKPFCALPEIVHNGTLMIDDIEDSSELRRGKPCTHKIYGVDVAINAGNAMYYLPLPLFRETKLDPKVLNKAFEIYYREMIRVSFGQAFDIWWHKGKAAKVTEAQYLQMCAYKTGCLARMAAQMGAVLANADEKRVTAVGKYAEALGVGFQIQDDVLNLVGEKFGELKGVGEDIHEGKRTLVAIHCLERAPAAKAKRLLEILDKHTENPKEIAEAIEIMKSAGSIEYAKAKARELASNAWAELEPLLPEGEAKEKLDAFTRYLVEREI
ncbi:polyprenyl synthetase [Candidatus Micrarchaeota archaeon CG09_land_8_20_14_0_10_60_16]|nr:MAG: polyprenyl synthetase [Candidatus Micrarchaeota archaeon CG09_land_8_20_14_0_10_60_16]